MADEELPPLIALIQANIEEFIDKMNRVETRIDEVSNQVFDVKLGVDDVEEVLLRLDELDARLDEYGAKRETAHVNVDTSDADDKIDKSFEGLGAMLSSILAFGPALSAVAATAAASFVAIPGIIGGVGVAAGAVALSIHGISGALSAYQAAATNTGQTAAEAATQMQALRAAMGGLAPAAQQFVIFYETGLKPVLDDLSKADQQIIFSGLLDAIRSLVPLFQELVPFILEAAQGISDFVQDLAQFLGSSQGLDEVNTILQSGLDLMKGLGDAALIVIEAMTRLGSEATPIISGIAQGAKDVANALNNWTINGGAQNFIAYVVAIGPQLFHTLGEIGAAFIAVVEAFGSIAGPALQVLSFLAKMLAELIQINPMLAGFVLTGIGIVSLLGQLAGPVSAATTAIKGISGALGLIGPAAGEAAAASAPAFAAMLGPIGLVVAAIGGIVAAFALANNALSQYVAATTQQAGQLDEDFDTINSKASSATTKTASAVNAYVNSGGAFSSPTTGPILRNNTNGPVGPQSAFSSDPNAASPVSSTSASIAAIQKQIAEMVKSIDGSAKDSFNNLYANGVAGTAAQNKAVATAYTALDKSVTAAHQSGLSDLNSLLTATHSGSLSKLNTALNETHLVKLGDMVETLQNTHQAELEKLSTKLTAAQRTQIQDELKQNEDLSSRILTAVRDAQTQQTREAKAIETAEAAARVAATVTANNTMAADVAKGAQEIAAAAAQLASDASKLNSDTASGQVSSISDAAAVSSAQSAQQVAAIQDQSQIIIDTAAEASQTGAALAAQQALVALDVQKQTDDARINADQIAIAIQKQTDDALISAATIHADNIAIQQDNLVAAATAKVNTVTIADAVKVNAATIANAVAEAGKNVGLQTSTTRALLTATQDQSTDLQNVQDALTGAQSAQTAANGGAASALSAIQASAGIAEALLAAQLASDQGSAAVSEANLQAIYSQLSAISSATSSIATSAASPSVTPINVSATVVTQIDGQTVAIMTTPLIRQELLRTSARTTQNLFGGSAGRLNQS